MPQFSRQSKKKLETCHADLQRLCNELIKEIDFIIICGARTLEDQQKAYNEGFSKIDGIKKKSMHQISKDRPKSLAVDMLPYPLNWNDAKGHKEFADKVLKKAADLGIKIVWGGNWKTFKDRPHFELSGKIN